MTESVVAKGDAMRQSDIGLLAKINEAVAAANEAETKVTTAQAELVSRSKTVGLLLLEAKKLHPAVKDFEAFLKKVQGLKLSRAYDLHAYRRRSDDRRRDQEGNARSRREAPRQQRSCRSQRPEPDFRYNARCNGIARSLPRRKARC